MTADHERHHHDQTDLLEREGAPTSNALLEDRPNVGDDPSEAMLNEGDGPLPPPIHLRGKPNPISADAYKSLNTLQKEAVEHILHMKKGQFYLNGPAGTGKSFTACTAIAMLMRKKRRKGRILILCPTHIAKLQFTLRLPTAWLEGQNPPVELRTVSAFLGSGPQADKVTGRDHFPKGAFRTVEGVGIVFVDEVSMIGEYELGEISKASKDIPVVYLGDANQLLPVMKRASAHFFHGMETITLTEQMRNSGPVLKLCEELRRKLVYPQKTVRAVNEFGDVSQIIVHESRDEMIESFLIHLKNSPTPWESTYLAFTNLAVERVKRLAHHALYGDAVYCVGEFLRLGRHIPGQNGNPHLGHRGNILQVRQIIGHEQRAITRNFTTEIWKLEVYNIDMKVSGVIKCVAPEEQERFLDLLEEMYQECSRLFSEKRMEAYEELRDEVNRLKQLANLKSPFSQTIHSAQGRSIPHVFVDSYNIADLGRDRRRLMYVGCSRTQYDLHVVRVTPALQEEFRERRSKRRAAKLAGDLQAARALW
ncbi:AAA family ATPase [Formicincola oecophyllae]|uniref:DNA 3'-5' helicase II n=1 Tax=Formicincola oecophyllae TaxID=2558361 RepID=A0A4Y6U8G8_9PROT|nr:AAA family ATPase [Formicincola oecophyllae]QDH13484.1 AAA family ATPase [Formicincola oecophyllae]